MRSVTDYGVESMVAGHLTALTQAARFHGLPVGNHQTEHVHPKNPGETKNFIVKSAEDDGVGFGVAPKTTLGKARKIGLSCILSAPLERLL